MTYADVIYVSKRTPKETEASIESSLRADVRSSTLHRPTSSSTYYLHHTG